jgi:hypothetical protein
MLTLFLLIALVVWVSLFGYLALKAWKRAPFDIFDFAISAWTLLGGVSILSAIAVTAP